MVLDQKTILKELERVVDPEIGVSIVHMNMIDKLEINGGEIKINFHLTSPYCPPMFALKIAHDIKQIVSKIDGVKSVQLNVSGHTMTDELNKTINQKV